MFFDESVTNGWTDGQTDGRTNRRTDGQTDRPSYRDARTHLKIEIRKIPSTVCVLHDPSGPPLLKSTPAPPSVPLFDKHEYIASSMAYIKKRQI